MCALQNPMPVRVILAGMKVLASGMEVLINVCAQRDILDTIVKVNIKDPCIVRLCVCYIIDI